MEQMNKSLKGRTELLKEVKFQLDLVAAQVHLNPNKRPTQHARVLSPIHRPIRTWQPLPPNVRASQVRQGRSLCQKLRGLVGPPVKEIPAGLRRGSSAAR